MRVWDLDERVQVAEMYGHRFGIVCVVCIALYFAQNGSVSACCLLFKYLFYLYYPCCCKAITILSSHVFDCLSHLWSVLERLNTLSLQLCQVTIFLLVL